MWTQKYNHCFLYSIKSGKKWSVSQILTQLLIHYCFILPKPLINISDKDSRCDRKFYVNLKNSREESGSLSYVVFLGQKNLTGWRYKEVWYTSLRNFMKSEVSVLQQFQTNDIRDVTVNKRKKSGDSNHPAAPYLFFYSIFIFKSMHKIWEFLLVRTWQWIV